MKNVFMIFSCLETTWYHNNSEKDLCTSRSYSTSIHGQQRCCFHSLIPFFLSFLHCGFYLSLFNIIINSYQIKSISKEFINILDDKKTKN
ncbi:MAG: hypothetical protein ACI8RD_011238 [Bacillariaceae sp.]|jgi:hypothetical protein